MAHRDILCHQCAHLGPGLACNAFPEGIPPAIVSGELEHTFPIPGDSGIQFRQDSRILDGTGGEHVAARRSRGREQAESGLVEELLGIRIR